MVTPVLAVWKPWIQASWAEPCEEAPMPLRVPSSVEAVAPSEAGAAASFDAQEESARAVTAASAAALLRREIFTWWGLPGDSC
jgi:hypothetical protein